MSTSQVFYRWGAGRDESRVTFTGTLISVFDFKRQVMLDNNLGNGREFDLVAFENGEGKRASKAITDIRTEG